MVKAKDIMTPNPTCCKVTDSVLDAVRVMKNEDCGIVPITDESGQCVGLVTDRDICLKVILERKDPQSTILRDVMTSNVITCNPEDSLEDIIPKMQKYMIRRILVTDESGKRVGIISEADIALKVRDKSKVADLVEAVSH